jgi:hypothetical protein
MNESETSQSATQSTEQPLPVLSASSVSSAVETDLANLQAENDSLRHELRLRNARDKLTRTLAAENARSPELLFEAASSRLSFDDTGNLQNLSEIIADIKSRFPEQFVVEDEQQTAPLLTKEGWTPERRSGWFSSGESTAPPINAGAGRSNIRPSLTKEMLAGMKPREILSLDWNEVKQVMERSN